MPRANEAADIAENVRWERRQALKKNRRELRTDAHRDRVRLLVGTRVVRCYPPYPRGGGPSGSPQAVTTDLPLRTAVVLALPFCGGSLRMLDSGAWASDFRPGTRRFRSPVLPGRRAPIRLPGAWAGRMVLVLRPPSVCKPCVGPSRLPHRAMRRADTHLSACVTRTRRVRRVETWNLRSFPQCLRLHSDITLTLITC